MCVCVLLNVSSPPKPQHGARHDVGCLLSVRDCEMLFFVSFLFWWFFSRFALQHHPAPSTIASYRCQATPAPALLFMFIPLVVWDCCVSFFFIPISHDALVVVSGGCASGDSLHSSYQGECCVCFFLFFSYLPLPMNAIYDSLSWDRSVNLLRPSQALLTHNNSRPLTITLTYTPSHDRPIPCDVCSIHDVYYAAR